MTRSPDGFPGAEAPSAPASARLAASPRGACRGGIAPGKWESAPPPTLEEKIRRHAGDRDRLLVKRNRKPPRWQAARAKPAREARRLRRHSASLATPRCLLRVDGAPHNRTARGRTPTCWRKNHPGSTFVRTRGWAEETRSARHDPSRFGGVGDHRIHSPNPSRGGKPYRARRLPTERSFGLTGLE